MTTEPKAEDIRIEPEKIPSDLPRKVAESEVDRFFSAREKRDDKIHELLHWLVMVSIGVGYLLILSVGSIWLYHFLVPKGWYHWLNDEKLEAIRWFITGVFGSHILAEFVKKKIQLDK